MPRTIERRAQRADASIHHVRWRDHVHASVGVADTQNLLQRRIPPQSADDAVVEQGVHPAGTGLPPQFLGGSLSERQLPQRPTHPHHFKDCLPAAEAALVGNAIDDTVLATVAAACSAACNPIDDKRGTIAYRRHVAGVMATRAVKIAAERAAQATGGS